jgi:hypothetical protein
MDLRLTYLHLPLLKGVRGRRFCHNNDGFHEVSVVTFNFVAHVLHRPAIACCISGYARVRHSDILSPSSSIDS